MKVKSSSFPKNVLEWIDDRVYTDKDIPVDLEITLAAIVDDLKKSNELSDRDAEIFYGFFKDNKGQTALAEMYEVTRERLRQIINTTCYKIRCLNKQAYYDALHNGLRELIDSLIAENAQLNQIISKLPKDVVETAQGKKRKPIKERELEELGLSTRTYNALKKAGMNYVSDVLNYNQPFSLIAQLGAKSYRELSEKFIALGLGWNGTW